MTVRIEGNFIRYSGCFKDADYSGEYMAKYAKVILIEKGYNANAYCDGTSLWKVQVETDIDDIKKVCKKLIKCGAYKVRVEIDAKD